MKKISELTLRDFYKTNPTDLRYESKDIRFDIDFYVCEKVYNVVLYFKNYGCCILKYDFKTKSKALEYMKRFAKRLKEVL